ncbi:MAG: sugar transferase [Rhizobiaceae bacterium]
MKRAFDLTATIILIVVLAPVFILVAGLVWWKLGSPVIFRQTRPGRSAKPFVMLKFRTMRDATDGKGTPLPDEQRLTPFGRFLRSTSLDELPELFNVLKGEMSLVGPRPLLMQYVPLYSSTQMRRHEVAPGITGWAQVNGRNALSWDDKFKLDVWYVDNRSFWLDIKIIALTLDRVIRRSGISADGHATSQPFTGSAGNDGRSP